MTYDLNYPVHNKVDKNFSVLENRTISEIHKVSC